MFAICFLLSMFGADTTGDLIKKLGSGSFAARSSAHATLAEKMDFETYLKLRSMEIKDVEASRRVSVIVTDYEAKLQLYYRGQVSLRGYPKYPWYQWATRDGNRFVEKFLEEAGQTGGPGVNSPDYTDYRTATQLSVIQRLQGKFYRAVDKAKSEAQFHDIMRTELSHIQKDLDAWIQLEDNWWKRQNANNPLREVKPK